MFRERWNQSQEKNLINLNSKVRIVSSAWNETYLNSFLIAYANCECKQG